MSIATYGGFFYSKIYETLTTLDQHLASLSLALAVVFLTRHPEHSGSLPQKHSSAIVGGFYFTIFILILL